MRLLLMHCKLHRGRLNYLSHFFNGKNLKINGKCFGTHCGEHVQTRVCVYLIHNKNPLQHEHVYWHFVRVAIFVCANSPNSQPPTAEKRQMTQTKFNRLEDEHSYQPRDPQNLRQWRVILRNWVLLLPFFWILQSITKNRCLLIL